VQGFNAESLDKFTKVISFIAGIVSSIFVVEASALFCKAPKELDLSKYKFAPYSSSIKS
jgi:hypothetical protein